MSLPASIRFSLLLTFVNNTEGSVNFLMFTYNTAYLRTVYECSTKICAKLAFIEVVLLNSLI